MKGEVLTSEKIKEIAFRLRTEPITKLSITGLASPDDRHSEIISFANCDILADAIKVSALLKTLHVRNCNLNDANAAKFILALE